MAQNSRAGVTQVLVFGSSFQGANLGFDFFEAQPSGTPRAFLVGRAFPR